MLSEDLLSHRVIIAQDLMRCETLEHQLNLLLNFNSELKILLKDELGF